MSVTKRKVSIGRDVDKKIKAARLSPPLAADDLDGFIDSETDQGDLDGSDEYGETIDPMIDPQDSPASSDMENEVPDDDQIAQRENEGVKENQPQAGPSRPKTGLYAPLKPPPSQPTMILPSSSSSSSTSFQLSLSALLSSTIVPQQPALKSLLSGVHDMIAHLPSLPPVSPKEALKRLGKMRAPLVAPDEFGLGDNVKWKLGWEKPAEIMVGGTWSVAGSYKRAKGESGSVDLVLIMPESLFTPKDRLDYRYFHKRAHYLAVVAKALSEQTANLQGAEVAWAYPHGDRRRPVVQLSVGKAQGLRHATEIIIHVGIPAGLFLPSGLSPARSLLRHASLDDSPTPLYASSLAHDSSHKANLLHLHRLTQSLPDNLVERFLASWRIWARRRGIRRERGGSGWFAQMILGWIVNGGEIGGNSGSRGRMRKSRGLGKGLNVWEALRASWEFFAETDFRKSPVLMANTEEPQIPPRDFLNSFGHVLVDFSGTVNVLAGWEEGDVELLRHHARESLAMLEEGRDLFPEVFLRDRTLGLAAWDELVRVDISLSAFSGSLPQRIALPGRADLLAHGAADVLRRGLSNRAHLVHVSPINEAVLEVGVLLNASHATRLIDIGPASSDEAGCKIFRELWGEKAELRRFKDGSISESVVWEITRPEDATRIPGQAIAYLLERHLHVTDVSIIHLSSEPEWLKIVQVPDSARNAIALGGSEKLGFRPMMDGYDYLYKLLKSADNELPLSILNVSPASESLRYSSTFVPHPIDATRFASAPDCLKDATIAEVVVEFESSPKWPDDLVAIQKVKLALFEKLARIVLARQPSALASVALDHVDSEIEDQAALEILLPSGVAFRLRIHLERERTILERALSDKPKTPAILGTATPQPSRGSAIPALATLTRRFLHLPSHHSALAPTHHRYPSISSATRLLKRWLAAHMLSMHVSSEASELLMASVYLDPGCLGVPASAVAGFVRALERLAEWSWREEPIFVPVVTAAREPSGNGRVTFPVESRANSLEGFAKMRKRDAEVARGAWCLVTEHDETGLRWTRERPGRVVAARIGALAKATLAALPAAASPVGVNVRNIFTSPTDAYDLLIDLKPSLVSRLAQGVSANADEWESKIRSVVRNAPTQSVFGSEVRPGFDLIESFVVDLERLYGEALLFFHDRHGGTTIGGIWNPAKTQPRNLKALLGYSTRPVASESGLVTFNKAAVIAEIARLGDGLIERMQVHETS